METKLCRNHMERVRRSCDFANGIEVDSEGTRGGLCLAWRNDVNIMLRNFSKRHINVIVEDNERKFLTNQGTSQGDPLSPFLFLICGEGLSCLMRIATREGLLKGVKVSRSSPQVSHLLFADDCILFGEATIRGATLLKGVLRKYRTCSGQCVNFDKSTVFFSKNTSEEDRCLIVNILGVRSTSDLERYLGLPNMVGRRKKESFQNLKDRFKKCIDNWSVRYLSQSGKEVFIKAIL
ncbi:hypothetical protein J1N35_025318 [Gossypium stocksii]|uniref:Reverse transcriptase domain-containing protein n=1 Tax=Gossypium stocksii TaxID=47602 RepID=A0A9D3ZW31_9ROSI|nr:hypothetical protein J1N35_025318 [Gossypium stocksii]